ncbi:MAG: hypothetical protein LV479_05490 [Methylacidiphilales bacterium]|nr:hypothetical protein [Candidatus Methylacidiphilales bacterium]
MPRSPGRPFDYARDPVFLCCLAIYVINRLIIKPHLHTYSPFFHGHLDDSLTVPVALPLYLLAYRWLGLRPDDAPPRWWEVGLHLAVWIFFFKWFGPVILHHGAPDPVDAWAMLIGGAVAWALWQRNPIASATA